MTKTTITGCLLAASLALAACGGGSSTTASPPGAANGGATASVPATTASTPTTSTTSGPGLSRVELAAKAGAICSAATAEGRKLAVPADLTTNAHAAAAYFDKAVPPLDTETRAFQALTPAPSASADWEAVLGAQVALDRLADGYRQTAHAGRETSLADVQQLITVGQTIADAAIRLGVRCV